MIWVWQIKPPSSPEGRFTQILSVGIGGSALGPQFVAEALAPDNPPLKVIQSNPSQPNIDVFGEWNVELFVSSACYSFYEWQAKGYSIVHAAICCKFCSFVSHMHFVRLRGVGKKGDSLF